MRNNTNRLFAFLFGTALLLGCGSANAVTPMLAAGYSGSLFLNSDGSVWGTGDSINYLTGATSPVRLDQLPNVIEIATGDHNNFALLADGTLWGSGINNDGVLGDGTTQWRFQPQAVPGLSGIKAIAAAKHVLALKQDGTVWAWGSNEWGQLGDGTRTDRYVPTQVIGLTNVTKIIAAVGGSLALKADGTVWMWGSNCCGAAGDGVVITNSSDPGNYHLIPTQVHNLDRVIAISGDGNHSMALRDDGTVWTWGSGGSGENGTGDFDGKLLPVQIPSLSGIVAIEARGAHYSLAVKADGTVWAWGVNNVGQLGVSGITYSAIPVQVPGLLDIVAISSGWHYVLAMRRDGSMMSWGWNEYGQLGDGSLQDHAQPRPVSGPGGSGQLNLLQPAPVSFNQLPLTLINLSASAGLAPLTVSANANNSTDPDGTIIGYSWKSSDGQQATGPSANFVFTRAGTYQISLLAEDNAGGRGSQWQQVVVAPAFVAVSATPKVGIGGYNSSALTNDGRVLTWGYRPFLGLYDAQLQYSLPYVNSHPITTGISGAVDVAVGLAHQLVLLADGTVIGWGDNSSGAVGAGSVASGNNTPQQLLNLPPVQALAVGAGHSLALTRDGRVFAWGNNTSGQLGVGDNQNRYQPSEVTGLTNVIAISAGGSHSAALKADGTVWAWGLVDGFNLGGSSQTPNRPTQIPGLSGITRIFSAMSAVIFAQAADGTVWVTGNLPFAVAGDPGSGAGPRHLAAFDGAVQIAGSSQHIIALKADGTVWTGGQQQSFALGFADGGDTAGLRQIPGIVDAVWVAAGPNNTMVLRHDGTALSWGINNYGQLGDGTLAQRPMPVSVVNETADGVLDLIPEVANAPYAGAALPFFTVVASDSAIVDAKPTITNTTKFNAADVGKSGAVYVTATVPSGSLVAQQAMNRSKALGATPLATSGASSFVQIQLTPSGWQLVVNGQLIPYASGVLGDQLAMQTILSGTDTTNLKGAEFCVGYGTSAEEMTAAGRMRAVVTIPDPNGTGTVTISCIIDGGSVATIYVLEFYNTSLDHYFITADASEASQIDNGSAGPGWSRTGNSFRSGGDTSVCRFYGSQSPGPNSHFYTVDSAECQGLKDQQIPAGDPRKLTEKSWNFESLDFISTPPTNGACLTGATPVYRAYNNGFARGVDSNHRITGSLSAIQEVVTRGWSNEGVVMCAPN